MDRPSTSHQSVEKIEVFEVREHVPYQAEVTRAPAAYDEESGEMYGSSWQSAWKAICQFVNLLHHMQIAIVVFCIWRFALNSQPDGTITNLQLHIVFAGTGYQLFLVESVLTLQRHNSWSSQISQDSKRIVHGCLQLIGSIFVLAGTFLGLSNTNMAINGAHGICVRLFLKSGPVKILHMAVGIFALSMGLITLILGFNSDFFRTTQGPLADAMIAFVVLILTYVLVQPVVDLVSTTRNAI
ncbi:unnamed protein product [Leptidea sinapis]|uniref:Cytochrome b561 domain-containing protein n=1 Tax=Leptidea sinapis TaxID=189913 RepID=A0A5E4QLJ5_9NEOP|nr:unnamed protein product [Leptidea sinapis]